MGKKGVKCPLRLGRLTVEPRARSCRNGRQNVMDISGNAPGWCRCSSIHTERDKSRLEMAELYGSREAAASQSRMTCDLDSTESADFCVLRKIVSGSCVIAGRAYLGNAPMPRHAAC